MFADSMAHKMRKRGEGGRDSRKFETKKTAAMKRGSQNGEWQQQGLIITMCVSFSTKEYRFQESIILARSQRRGSKMDRSEIRWRLRANVREGGPICTKWTDYWKTLKFWQVAK